MIASVSSVTILGMEARPVEVEVHVGSGVPDFQIVGLPGASIRESRQRVRSALLSSNEEWPQRRITVNLAPGDLRKEGVLLDLPLAVGVLAATGRLKEHRVRNLVYMGELSLDGRLRPVRGALAAALAARERGAEGLVLPFDNAAEAALVPGVKVMGASHLLEAIALTTGDVQPEEPPPAPEFSAHPHELFDLSDVRGQALARRALEISAAGGHNLLMTGPPGCGKTMLARRLPGVLPPLNRQEALEVTHVWSVAGLLRNEGGLISNRPFRAPHHQSSAAAVIGGGSPWPRPGEVSLAHKGVLFLDELPLFSRSVIEGLRQPLEDKEVTIARMGSTLRFPSDVCLVAAANPCPCGRLGDDTAECSCSPVRLEGYRGRLSGPLLDRVDLFVDLIPLSERELLQSEHSESSAVVRERVITARRLLDDSAQPATQSDWMQLLDPSARTLLNSGLLSKGSASARGFGKLLSVARTIAGLDGATHVSEEHLLEAVQFRSITWQT